MEAILNMVRSVTVFLLLAGIVSNMPGGESYRKYFSYVTGLVVIVLFLSPAVSFLTGKATVKFELNHDSYENQKKEILQEIEVVSEKSEESILQQYKEQIENQIKEMCREKQLDCAAEVSISRKAQIEQITIRIKDGKPVPSYLVGEIAALYQMKEDDIWIEGA